MEHAGDRVDIAIRQDHTFNADGTYDAYAAWSQYGGLDRESSKGSWSIDDDSFVLETNGTSKRYRIFGIGTHRGVHSVFLPPSYASTTIIQFCRPRSVGDWYDKVK